MKIFEFINRMSSIRRWSQVRCLVEDNVLEHTAFVGIYALHICYKNKIQWTDILERALLHDMEEINTGDIPHPFKYSSNDFRLAVSKLEIDSAKLVSDEYFDGCAYEAWNVSKDESLGGQIIQLADMAAVVYKIDQEISLGNERFKDFISNVKNGLSYLQANCHTEIYDEIQDLINYVESLR